MPIAIAIVVFTLMMTWHQGRALLMTLRATDALPLGRLFESLAHHPPRRLPGTGVYLTSHHNGVPRVLLHHLRHEHVLHETVVLLSVESAHVPSVGGTPRVTVDIHEHGFISVVARFGFLEPPVIARALAYPELASLIARARGPVTYYLAHERVLATGRTAMSMWRKRLFVFLVRNAHPATDFFGIPPNATVELGEQIEI